MGTWTRRSGRRALLLGVAIVPVLGILAWGAVRVDQRGQAARHPAGPSADGAALGSTDAPADARPSGEAASHPPGSPASSRAGARGDLDGVRYEFDTGLGGAIVDRAGRLPLKARKAAGGDLAAVPHAGGLAVRFPRPCAQYGAESCQRAVLQSGPAGFLNPGRARFRYGASLLVHPEETSKGANVLQKGYSVGDSQFKLQVDGAAGRPSCVLVGQGSATIHVAMSSATVTDGQWHQVECSRGDALLTIAVDGQIRGQATIPMSLSIVNTDPLCIGGKGTSVNNDQFAGAVDDVFVIKEA